MPNPIAVWSGAHGLDDCTHYVCRCLLKEGVTLKETPRADELSNALINSHQTKTLAVQTSRLEGQKIVDSGVFKPGDFIGYYSSPKGRYDHTAMFVGRQKGGASDPGGITCHTVCRFQGLSAKWNGATDDNWFLHEEDGQSFTLVHFSADDAPISGLTLRWLPGWWKVGTEFYFVRKNGSAYTAAHAPRKATDEVHKPVPDGYYFDQMAGVTFTWKKPHAKIHVERWSMPPNGELPTIKADGLPVQVQRLF
jgi:hypothetical protein